MISPHRRPSPWVLAALVALCGSGAAACKRAPTETAVLPVDAGPAPVASGKAPSIVHPGPPLPAHGWSADKEALHVLDRLAYGPRPGDLEAVKKAGVSSWIQAQLAPESIADETVAKRLRELPSLALSTKEALAAYPRKKAAAKRDRDEPAMITPGAVPGMAPPIASGAMAAADEGAHYADDMFRELLAQKLLRAAGSERQLQETLTDFWFNHFNVFAHKGADLWMTTAYERDAIRPFLFGKFRQLLGATAHHPAMLFYLDNWTSKKGAINENYGRELLELHTLGVDGGYTQADVTEAARVLTGFGIDAPNKTGVFLYRPKDHDPGPETVLGKRFEGSGEDEGEHLLDLLAAHPATAKLICTRLAQVFVSDTPPPALITRLVKVFGDTGGDLRAVYQALFYSSEFWSDAAYHAKTKTPLELAVSAVRAVGATVDDPAALAGKIAGMGEPLYACAPPTGYKSTADAWIGTGALVARINFGIALASGRVKGVAFDRDKLLAGVTPEDEGALADRLAVDVLHEPLTGPTRQIIVERVGTSAKHVAYQEPPPSALPQTLGLLLGSPEFQKR